MAFTNFISVHFIFNNELLVQCDVVISGSNVRLRATPESGISGTTSFRVRREVT